MPNNTRTIHLTAATTDDDSHPPFPSHSPFNKNAQMAVRGKPMRLLLSRQSVHTGRACKRSIKTVRDRARTHTHTHTEARVLKSMIDMRCTNLTKKKQGTKQAARKSEHQEAVE